jgi:pyruvate, water dikinase
VRRIVWLEQYSPADRGVLGGKNADPSELTRAGLPAPCAFAVSAAAYTEAIQDAGLVGELTRVAVGPSRPQTLAEVGRSARELVISMPRPGRVDREVRDAYAGLCRRCATADVPVAVRSSATCEDLPDARFAGEHDSYLWVRGADEVYGLPAVTGTRSGTKIIKTGQRIRVGGSTGTVTILRGSGLDSTE